MELYNATALSLFCACVCERETSLGLSIDNTQSHFLIFVFSNCHEYPYKDMTIFSPKWHTDISLKTDSCHDANYLVAGGALAFRFDKSSRWHHQMETFSALLAICAGNSPVPGEFPTQRPVTRGFDVFFDLRLNKRFSKQSWGWWFETPSGSLWRQYNVDVASDSWSWHHYDSPILLMLMRSGSLRLQKINTLRPSQNRGHFADNIFTYIFFNKNVLISIKISLKLIPNGQLTIFQHWFR